MARAAVIIFEGGQAHINRHLLRPDEPVPVLVKAERGPSFEQLKACAYSGEA